MLDGLRFIRWIIVLAWPALSVGGFRHQCIPIATQTSRHLGSGPHASTLRLNQTLAPIRQGTPGNILSGLKGLRGYFIQLGWPSVAGGTGSTAGGAAGGAAAGAG